MDKSSDQIKHFEAILRTQRNYEKKVALYNADENRTSNSFTKVLKPKDVLTTVSNQLRDIQKADSLRKDIVRYNTAKSRQEFVPISVLSREEVIQPQDVTKFDTYYVTDTQLVDVVDSIEAMVNIDNNVSKNLQTFQSKNQFNLEDSINDKCTLNCHKNNQEIKQLCDLNRVDLCIDDINTDICAEFNASYSKTNDNTCVRKSKENEAIQDSNVRSCPSDVVRKRKQSHCDDGGDKDDDMSYSNINLSSFDKSIEDNYNMSPVIKKICDNPVYNYNDEIEESCSYVKSNLELTDTDPDLASESNFSSEKEVPKSPVFKIFKVKVKTSTPPPLVFPLDSFEKFESFVRPLVEDNLDFEAVKKHLISSQLIKSSNVGIALEKPVDNLIPKNMNGTFDEKLLDIDINKDGQALTSINSTEKKNEDGLSFEDEILFSSDEENEYFHYCTGDLPMTCALKTTVNESKVDLDESIFVGFQTSSNKCIQVCKDSFIKAKQIFNSIDDKKNASLTLTEVVDIYDSNITTINNNLPLKPLSDRDCSDTKKDNTSNKHTNNTSTTKYANDKVLPEKESNAFEIIQGKSFDMSNKSLIESKSYFRDNKKKNILKVNDDTCAINFKSQKREFIGFKTASNKKIKLSEESLAKTSNILKDIDLDLNNLPLDMPFKFKNSVQEHIKVPQDENSSGCVNILDKNKIYNDGDDHISIVDQTLLEEFENESVEEHSYGQNYLDDALATFPSEMETIIKKSDTNLKNSNNIPISIDGGRHSGLNFDPGILKQFNNRNKENTNMFGFKTANNKEIKISKAALAKTKDLFNDITFDEIKCDKATVDHNIEPSCKDNDMNSDKRVIKCANINSSINDKLATGSELFGVDKEKPCVFQGFKTASNKPVKISEEAFSKVKNIFQDINAEFETPISCKNNLDQANADKSFHNAVKNKYLCFDGFKTVSDKEIVISEDAFVKTKHIFKEPSFENPNLCKSSFEEPDENKPNVNAVIERYSGFQGFKTASHKQVIISEDALANTKHIFKELMFENTNLRNSSSDEADEMKSNHTSITNKYSSFQGFKTASDKQVVISEDALANTKDIFKEPMFGNPNLCDKNFDEAAKKDFNDDVVTKDNLGFSGFKTASDKQVVISEDALAKTKHIFKDIELEASTLPENKDSKAMVTEHLPPLISSPIISKEERVNTVSFKGFQTASNKTVKISDEALAKSRKLFEEIKFDPKNKEEFEEEVCFVNKENNVNKCQADVQVPFGFRTATNKFIKISEDALTKSRQLLVFDNVLADTKRDIHEIKVPMVGAKNNVTIDNIINTQVLNNFEESLHTEDFSKDTSPNEASKHKTKQQHCKRSGSPILSCARAKKRKKFEAPYRQDSNIMKIERTVCETKKENVDQKYKFSDDYKKSKLYTLKELDETDKNYKCDAKIDPYILNFDYDTLLKFEFAGSRNDYADVRWTTDNIKTCFVESVNRKIIPEGWLDNHLKLIIWKLISYEIRFPNVMHGACSVSNVLEQLKYRYDKELYRVERPALRKMLEKDDVSTRTMILAVVGIYVNGVKVQSVADPSSSTMELLVTDGWYCVLATADRMLARLVAEGRLAAGRKIATSGAEMLNNGQGVSPWEDTSSVRLQLFGNSTRPARWHAALGHAAATVSSPLSSIHPAGGKVSKVRALVARVYPQLYVERLEGGSTVTRSERLESQHQAKYETEKQIQLEKLYEEVEKEFFDQESSGSDGIDPDLRRSFQSGSQLKRCIKRNSDSSQFRSHLTESQSVHVQEYAARKKERVLEELQRRVQEEVLRRGLQVARNVVPLLKIRVAALEGVENGVVSKATISIWRPSDAVLEVVREGAWIDIYNIVPTAIRNSELQMSAGRQSIFQKSKQKGSEKMKSRIESLKRKCFAPKELRNPSLKTDFNEIDTCGVVFLTEPKPSDFEPKKHHFQNVYLTDLDKNFVCINFWGGTKKFGYENIFDTGNIVACMNLQKRIGNTGKNIPQYRATELSVFTETPKLDTIRNVIFDLNKNMIGLDMRKFCEDCVSLKNNYSNIRQLNEFSPYRFNTSDHNLTRNKVFIDSPLAQNKDVNINLTGLDFESTFRQTDTQDVSPAVLKRKQMVKEKIARLKMYGEPPPLSKIHIILNQSKNAGSAYKSPLAGATNVATVKNFTQSPATSKELQSSPVLSLNRTFVVRPGMNPVKLNFSPNSLGDEKLESNPFAEEFDPSPPLSLD